MTTNITVKTREEVMDMLERAWDSLTAVRYAAPGITSGDYITGEIAALVDGLEDCEGINGLKDYEFVDCLKAVESAVEPEDYEFMANTEQGTASVNIDIWAQEFGQEDVDSLKAALAAGELYVARFWSAEKGSCDILIWE